jgi:3-dehydroquinate dehydratase/shikimate dehydrogenase
LLLPGNYSIVKTGAIVAKICLCLTAKTLRRNLEILDKYRKFTDIAELRVDCLEPNERFLIRKFPEQAGLPVILSIRRTVDGGYFTSGEGARVHLLARGLAYAEANRRLNFAYVDIEEDLYVPSLEEAARTFGTRIIRSWYSTNGNANDIHDKIRNMKCIGDDIIKISAKANSVSDVLRILQASWDYPKQDKIFFCTGQYGLPSKILAEQFGSYLSYSCTPDEMDTDSDCKIDIRDLAGLYNFRSITKSTKLLGMAGNPPLAGDTLHFYNTIFALEEIDAVYVPFPADSIFDFMELADNLGVSGIAVSEQYKKEIISCLHELPASVTKLGVCDTVFKCGTSWSGFNNYARAFSEALLKFSGRKNLRWKKVTLIGSGSLAKLAALELLQLGAKVLVLSHSNYRDREWAGYRKFILEGLDQTGIESMEKFRDIIIKTDTYDTASGNEESGDPLDMYVFTGREAVMDLTDKSGNSRFLSRARNAGCRVIDAYDMLVRQVQYQYAQFMGKDFPVQLLSRIHLDRS